MKRITFCLIIFVTCEVIPSRIFGSIFSTGTTALLSQKDNEQKEKEHRERWNKALGSFQFQVINSRQYPSINISIIEKIESSRHKTDTVYIPYSESIRILILPEATISGNYKKLEHIRHINGNEK